MSHTVCPTSNPILWENATNTGSHCRTAVSHKRSIGVWLRGSIYQFRIRVPNDVRGVVRKSHLSRSLKTDSLTLANRLAAKLAIEAEALFDGARGETPKTLIGKLKRDAHVEAVGLSFEELCER